MRPALLLAAPIAFAAGLAIAGFQYNQSNQGWVKLFDGKSLKGWTPKIKGYPLGENFGSTFRVKDGVIQVGYEAYNGEFKSRFGHLFHQTPRSNYIFRCEYRFTGEQCPGGPGWARRNSGVMIHGQDPATMTRDQEFPVSLEVQFLGGLGEGPRSTANLCTPGTNVVMNGELVTRHCTDSTSATYDGEQWVRVEVLVHGDELVRHMVDGQTVLEYSKPQIGGSGVAPVDAAVKVDGRLLTSGYIALQAETAPVEFRKVELLNLEGCSDTRASNYKSYFVKSNPMMCR